MTGTRRPKRPRVSESEKEVDHEGDGFARKKKGKGEDNMEGEDHLTEQAEMHLRNLTIEVDRRPVTVCGSMSISF